MTDLTQSAHRLHSLYCKLTGLPLTLVMRHIFAWEAWQSHGWSDSDLQLVIQLLKSKIAQGRKWPASLNFRNLIEREDEFSELLAEAKASKRASKPPLGRTTHQTGMTAPEPETVRSAAQIIAAEAAFEQFRALKERL